MAIIVAIISILIIAGVIFSLNKAKILPFKVCPVCAGVSGTWLWLLAARFLGYEIDSVILAMLMGSSIAGVAYQFSLIKILFIPLGFIIVYSILMEWWGAVLLALIFMALFLLLSKGLAVKNSSNSRVNELIKKMKNCC